MRNFVTRVRGQLRKRSFARLLGRRPSCFNTANLLTWSNIVVVLKFFTCLLSPIIRKDIFEDLFVRALSILKEFLHLILEFIA